MNESSSPPPAEAPTEHPAILAWRRILGVDPGDNVNVRTLDGFTAKGKLLDIVVTGEGIPLVIVTESPFDGGRISYPWSSIAFVAQA